MGVPIHVKRSTHEGSALVYPYGAPFWADLDEEGMRQLRLAHQMYNELVAIELWFEDRFKKFISTIPECRDAELAYDEALKRLNELKQRLKQERIPDRSTRPRPITKDELVVARKVFADTKKQRKWFRDQFADVLKPFRSELNSEKKALTGKEYDHAWSAKGLFWPMRNEVRRRVKTAIEKVISNRKEGEPSELHPQRWTGEGTIYVQNMKQEGKPRRVEWEIAGDHRKKKTLRLRICGLYWMEIPFVYHRPLPCGPQEVTEVRVKRELIAGRPRITIHFTCLLQPVKQRTNGTSLGVWTRWKRCDIGIVVAQIASYPDPLPPIPRDLESVIEIIGSRHVNVIFPDEWMRLLGRDDHIRSNRDEKLEKVRAHLLAARPELEAMGIIDGDPAKWRSHARFDTLCQRLPKEHSLYPLMEAWRRENLHLWQYEARERDQVIARRRDAWRKVAAWVISEAQSVELAGADYSELRKRPDTEEDSYESRYSRRQIQLVAPGELRLYIEQAARKNGVAVMMVKDERRTENG